MPAVISDTSVLHYLAAVRQFDCLPKIFGNVIIPTAVWRETSQRTDLAVFQHTARAIAEKWLRVESAKDTKAVESLQGFLGAGESEAIILARELKHSLLLMDDLDGRHTAQKMKLPVTGTLGVLLRARKLGIIVQLKPVLDQLATHRFRLERNLYLLALQEVGESE